MEHFRIHASVTANKDKKRGSSGTVVKSVLVEERPLYTCKPNHTSLESQEQAIKEEVSKEEAGETRTETESENSTTMSAKTQELDSWILLLGEYQIFPIYKAYPGRIETLTKIDPTGDWATGTIVLTMDPNVDCLAL